MTMKSQIPTELIDEYRATEYRIGDGPERFTLRIGCRSDALAGLFRETNRPYALFITAYNPFSETQSEEENQLANESLLKELLRLVGSVTAGIGINPAGVWPGEPGFLALGMDGEAARALGTEYRQNAVVWADDDAVPQLVLLR